jgi:hypothetical protein
VNHVRITTLVLLILIGIDLAASPDAKLPEPSAEQSVWHIDLRSQGATGESLGVYWFTNHRHPDSSLSIHSVTFNSLGQGAVSFTTYQVKNGGGYVPGTGRVHLISFESATGKLITTSQWPIRRAFHLDHAPILGTNPKGNFLLENAEQLALYSPTLQLIASSELGDGSSSYSYWMSPDGRYAFFSHKNDTLYKLSMVDTETLQVVRSWILDGPVAAASEHHLAMWREAEDHSRKSLYVRTDGPEWKEFYEEHGCDNRLYASARFLSDDVLLVFSCNRLFAVTIEHKMLFSQTFSPSQSVDVLWDGFSRVFSFYGGHGGQISFDSSSDGRRFAVAVDQIKRDPWWTGDPGKGPVPWRVLIYDAVKNRAISSFALHGTYPSSIPSLSFAFSPDGSELALIRDGELELLRLPPLGSAP